MPMNIPISILAGLASSFLFYPIMDFMEDFIVSLAFIGMLLETGGFAIAGTLGCFIFYLAMLHKTRSGASGAPSSKDNDTSFYQVVNDIVLILALIPPFYVMLRYRYLAWTISTVFRFVIFVIWVAMIILIVVRLVHGEVVEDAVAVVVIAGVEAAITVIASDSVARAN